MKKYELTEETIEWFGGTLHRIRAWFKIIKATKQGYRQGKQQHDNKASFSHTVLKNNGNF